MKAENMKGKTKKGKTKKGTRIPVPRVVLTMFLVTALLPLMGIALGLDQAVQATAISGSPPGTVVAGVVSRQAQGDNASSVYSEKEEVIYALLDNDGKPRSGYVVNHFKIVAAGTLIDYGNYTSMTNLTSTAQMAKSGNQISIPVEKGDFYYEGVLSTIELPWIIEISYLLNGSKVTPTKLAGASGRLEIEIKTRQNGKVDPVFFENYVLQIQLTMPSDRVEDLNAPGATIASAGKNAQVVFMVLPSKNSELWLSAQVSNFEMQGIQISGVPFSLLFDVPDTSSMIKDMSDLTSAISELNNGVGQLQSGVSDLQSGAAALAAGSSELESGLKLLSSNSAVLVSASTQIDSTLAMIAQQMSSGIIDVNQVALLIDGLRQLSAGLSSGDPGNPGLAEALALIQGYVSSSIAFMDSLIDVIATISDTELLNMTMEVNASSLSNDSKDTIHKLATVYGQAAALVYYWYTPNGMRDGFDSAATGLDTPIANCLFMSAQLTTIANELEANLGSLSDLVLLAAYLEQLSVTYSTFNEGMISYSKGISTLASDYASFDNGLNQFLERSGSLYSGIASLYSGSNEIILNIGDLPQTMQDEISSFLDNYLGSDFVLESYVAAENVGVSRVQFIMLTDAIKAPVSEEKTTESSAPKKSFWDRLIDLFR